ncbi:Ketosteroid isomerase homolog [Paraburkholderia sacchari]|uniref:nuclear transport factor 2 family protein n=1 Tax=Paraburkholderia sacchari TaxID=159450 RepID=UPI0039A71F4D
MRNVNLVASTLFTVWPLAASLAFAQPGNVEQQIAALSDEMITANLKGDTDFYQRYYADDATIVHGNGKLFTKDQDIADLKSGALKYESIDVRERTIHVYGDTAVVHFLLTFKGSLSGKQFDPINLRRTVVWVNQKGNWKVVAWQVTRAENK